MQSKDYQPLCECPFCGGESELDTLKIITPRGIQKSIRIVKCQCGGLMLGLCESEAVTAWNRRANATDTNVGNKPLTLDELLAIDGEPVYVVEITGREEWLFRRNHGFMDVYGDWDTDAEMRFETYGELWWAYRQKPKEETP